MTQDTLLVLSFAIPCRGGPLSVNRVYRRGKGKRLFKSDEGKTYQNLVSYVAAQRMLGCIPFGECEVYLGMYFPTRRNDCDGPIKPTLDALQLGGVFKNDRSVVRVIAEKFLDPKSPRLEVRVRALDQPGWMIDEQGSEP